MTKGTNQLVDHLFRREAGKMTAILSNIFGLHQLQLAEDVVQEAFLKAAQTWPYNGVPDNPSGWLLQVAKNKVKDILNRQKYLQQYILAIGTESVAETVLDHFFLDKEITDSQLQMVFACCHPALRPEDQIALTLKVVSGFGAPEIARALVTNQAVIQKRLYRARLFLREQDIRLEIPVGNALTQRLETVHIVLYLLFNEGYNSIKADELIRKDLCAEAMRLCRLLTEHPILGQPASAALLSLMCFQASRFDSRTTETGAIVLLPEQDRSKWSKELITLGYHYLSHSARGALLTTYHIESAIAAEHCMAATAEQTNWMRLLQLYDLLLEQKPTPAVRLNRAIVLARLGYVQNAIQDIHQIPEIEILLDTQYIYDAVLGDLYLQAGNFFEGRRLLEKAMELTSSIAEKRLLTDKLAGL